MSPWESFFSSRISRRRSPIIMGHYCIHVWTEQLPASPRPFLPPCIDRPNLANTAPLEPISPVLDKRRYRPSGFDFSDYPGGLNGSTQHFLAVYSQGSENLKFVAGVDLSAALLCSDPTGNSRSGLFSSGSIVVTAR